MTSQPTQPESTTFVGTKATQARIARLRSRSGAAERVDSIRAEMAEVDRAYAENLAAVDGYGHLDPAGTAMTCAVAISPASLSRSIWDGLRRPQLCLA